MNLKLNVPELLQGSDFSRAGLHFHSIKNNARWVIRQGHLRLAIEGIIIHLCLRALTSLQIMYELH